MAKILIAGINEPSPRLEGIFRRLNVPRDCFTTDPMDDFSVVLAFGDAALKDFTGLSNMKKSHGYVHKTTTHPVIATYHPQFLAEGMAKLTPCVEMAIRKAVAVAGGNYVEDEFELHLNPTIAEAEELLEGQRVLMVDIETPMGNDDEDPETDASFVIDRVGISWAPGKALSVPWMPPFTGLIRNVLASAVELQYWNKYFDHPRLLHNGVVSRARIVDAQEAWHFLHSDMPRGLGFVAPFFLNILPWKHLSGSHPEFYNATDTAAQSLLYERIRGAIATRGGIETFDRHCVEAGQILARMGRITVDAKRQSDFMCKVAEDLRESDSKLQDLVPPELLPVKTYKKKAPVTSPFNPNSPTQVAKLSAHLGIELPKGTGAKFLRKSKNKLFKLILDCREKGKLLSTYNYKLDSNSQVKTTYTFKPSTWRKASQDPNLQNLPNRSELAAAFRCMFVARPGYTLIEADSSAIEAVIVGYCAESPEYVRLAKAGVHGWLCAAFASQPISLDLPDAELRAECLSWKKKDKAMYDKMKRVIHLSNYAGTPYRMNEEYPNDFPTQKAARTLQDFYYNTLPGKAVVRWHRATTERASKEKFLDSHWNYRHEFYAVHEYRNGDYVWGPDARRAIAFVPQNDASAIQTEILLSLPDWVQQTLRLIIHDSIVLEVPSKQWQIHALALRQAMTLSWPQLGGLSIGCEVKAGPSLGEMEIVCA